MKSNGGHAVSARAVREWLGQDVLATRGSMDAMVLLPGSLYETCGPGTLSYSTDSDSGAAERIRESCAAVVLCRLEVLESVDSRSDLSAVLIAVENPRLAFAQVLAEFFQPPRESGVDSSAVVAPSCEVGRDVFIGAHAFVGASRIGDGCVVHGHSYLYPGVVLGNRVTIHAGTVIGSDGFGYEPGTNGVLQKFPQLGGVEIGDDVEIGANVTIDRGTLGNTCIGAGAKIDNLAYIAHNATIGSHAMVMAQVCVAGSALIGAGARLSPHAVVRDKVSIGAGARVGLGAVVVSDVGPGETVAGVPARPFSKER